MRNVIDLYGMFCGRDGLQTAALEHGQGGGHELHLLRRGDALQRGHQHVAQGRGGRHELHLLRAERFNQPLPWDTRNVAFMDGTFRATGDWLFTTAAGGVQAFIQHLAACNTSAVISMAGMFDGARLLNANISGWDAASAGGLRNMFRDATSFRQSLCWDTGRAAGKKPRRVERE